MFKLFRDSIFNPKNIIHYRAKRIGFVLLYMLIISLFLGFSRIVGPLKYQGLNYNDKLKISRTFKDTDARIADGIFISSNTYIIELSDVNVAFIKTGGAISELSGNAVNIIILGDKIYYVVGVVNASAVELSTISELSGDLQNVNLYNINENSEFFTSINNVLLSFKPLFIGTYFVIGMINAIIEMLMYALITYLFMAVFYRVGDYMKKGQLFKMLIFATTAVIIAETLISLLSIGGALSFIMILASLIPLIVLEREIMKRIRMKILGESLMNNSSIIDKVNDIIKKTQDEKIEKDDNDIDYDADQDDTNSDSD